MSSNGFTSQRTSLQCSRCHAHGRVLGQ
jgi:hypothetical protein